MVNVERLCTGTGTKAGNAEAVKKLLHKNNNKSTLSQRNTD